VEEDPDMGVHHRADFLLTVQTHLHPIWDLAVEVVAEVVAVVVAGLLMARHRLQVLQVLPVPKALRVPIFIFPLRTTRSLILPCSKWHR
jgi:hypothetical protein